MSNGELKYPKWERQLQEAVLELNREKLVEKKYNNLRPRFLFGFKNYNPTATTILSVKQSRTRSQPSAC